VDQELIRFEPAVFQGPVEGLKLQGDLHGAARGPAEHTAGVQDDLYVLSQQVVQLTRGCEAARG